MKNKMKLELWPGPKDEIRFLILGIGMISSNSPDCFNLTIQYEKFKIWKLNIFSILLRFILRVCLNEVYIGTLNAEGSAYLSQIPLRLKYFF